MKKIIATVLAMVMALALCSTAFAVDYVNGKAYAMTGKNVTGTDALDVTYTAGDKDDKTVGYYAIEGQTGKFFVVLEKNKDAAFAIKGADGWTYMGEVAAVDYDYEGTLCSAKTVKASDAKCGDFSYTTAGEKVYSYVNADKETVYVLGTDVTAQSTNMLVDGKLVGVGAVVEKGAHNWAYTFDTDKVTVLSRKCATCGRTEKVIDQNACLLLKDADRAYEGGLYYQVVAAGSTSTGTTTGTTTSPKTFDAGIAMYVGMALTSVAGSAVVIGKKKEF